MDGAPASRERRGVSEQGHGVPCRNGRARPLSSAVPGLRDESPADPLRRQRDELLSALSDRREAARGSLAVEAAQERLAEVDRRARAAAKRGAAAMSAEWPRVIVHADMDAFYAAIEQLDEPFLDMTGSERLFGAPEEIGRRLKQAVRDATGGLTASVGISGTKYAAKVASGYAKPDGLTIVAPADAADWLAPQPVRHLWGAGPKTVERLERLGLATIGEIAAADSAWLERELGAVGRRFAELAQGRDFRGVSGSREARG